MCPLMRLAFEMRATHNHDHERCSPCILANCRWYCTELKDKHGNPLPPKCAIRAVAEREL